MSGNPPEPGLDLVLAKIRAVFADRSEGEVLVGLRSYGTEPHEREAYRVYLAILKLCDEDGPDELDHYVAAAKGDYRDVLFWAEYPHQARHDGVADRETTRKLAELDRAQYDHWLEEPRSIRQEEGR